MNIWDRLEDILSKHIADIPQGLLSDLASYMEEVRDDSYRDGERDRETE